MEFGTFLRRVGANLRKARWLAGMTQEDVAAKGITYRYYQELERGQRNATLQTLYTLARILKTPVAVLVDVDPAGTSKARSRFATAEAMPPRLGRKPKVGRAGAKGRR